MIYMVRIKNRKTGEIRFAHSGKSFTPCAYERFSSARAMATRNTDDNFEAYVVSMGILEVVG